MPVNGHYITFDYFPNERTNWSVKPSHLFSLVMCLEYLYVSHNLAPATYSSIYTFQFMLIHLFDIYFQPPGTLFLVIMYSANVFSVLFINTNAF